MNHPKFSHNNGPRKLKRGYAAPGLMLLASAGVTVLTGCGGMVNNALTPAGAGTTLQGKVFGGQQPISGATIQLYAAQATGYGVASSPLIASTVTSNANGGFSISGDYTCPASPNDQVYIAAIGGNSGSGVNSNIVQVAALGPCSSLSSSTFITISEVSTVAAAYALSGFAADYSHVSTSSTNYTGLVNAFATTNNLADLASGSALSVTPAYASAPTGTSALSFKSVVPQAEINTLANILSSCVNTNGVGGSSASCSTLFSNAKSSGGVTPTDTFQAALNIAQNPGSNVTALYNLAPATPPFAPNLASAPSDWTVALNFIGGGLGGPATPLADTAASNQVAVDASGNVWIADFRSSRVTELSPLGAPVSPNTQMTPSIVPGGYSGGGLSNPNGIAIDLNGVAWVANTNGTISELSSNGSPVGTGYTGGGLSSTVKAIAIDTANNVWAVSTGNNALSKFDNNGNALSGTTGYTQNISSPISLAINPTNQVWVSNAGNGYALKFDSNGNLLTLSNASSIQAPTGFTAVDNSGNFLVPNGSPANDLQLYSPSTGLLGTTYSPSSGINPNGVVVDGLSHIFTTNGGGTGTVTYAPNLIEMTSAGATLSPATGYLGTGSNLITATVKGVAVDGSGNLWLVNGQNQSTVTEFVGIGAPTATPLASAIKNNKVGVRP